MLEITMTDNTKQRACMLHINLPDVGGSCSTCGMMFGMLLADFHKVHLFLPLQSCSGQRYIGDIIHNICNIRRQMWVSSKDFDRKSEVPRQLCKFPQWLRMHAAYHFCRVLGHSPNVDFQQLLSVCSCIHRIT